MKYYGCKKTGVGAEEFITPSVEAGEMFIFGLPVHVTIFQAKRKH